MAMLLPFMPATIIPAFGTCLTFRIYRDRMPKNDPIAHVLGHRVDDVTHMCPAEGCGWPVRAFCPTCLGAGVVSEHRLAEWHREINATQQTIRIDR